MTHRAFLALGSNLGDGRQNLQKAIERIVDCVGNIIEKSSVVESEPWGFESENKFVNSVVLVETKLTPIELLDITQSIERELGRTNKRKPNFPYEDRIIDIDILFYDNYEIKTERLTLPHPHIYAREFVYLPLKEIEDKLKQRGASFGIK